MCVLRNFTRRKDFNDIDRDIRLIFIDIIINNLPMNIKNKIYLWNLD